MCFKSVIHYVQLLIMYIDAHFLPQKAYSLWKKTGAYDLEIHQLLDLIKVPKQKAILSG